MVRKPRKKTQAAAASEVSTLESRPPVGAEQVITETSAPAASAAAPVAAAGHPSAPTPHAFDLRDPSLYFNRELSWLEFNRRVLDEAIDVRHPLLERVKFLAIFSGNLDEFFMIRVSGLKDQIAAGVTAVPADGIYAVWVTMPDGSIQPGAMYIGKRNVEGGPRYDSLDFDSYRVVGGVKGAINDNWDYDLYYLFPLTQEQEGWPVNDGAVLS